MNEVLVSSHDSVTELVLNHPPTRNAITGPLGEKLAAAIQTANNDQSVRVIVIRGAEGAFCSGLNLKAFNAPKPPSWLNEFPKIWRQVHVALYESPKPIIVGLEKYAINGGAALALAADFLFVGEKSYLQVGEVQMGMAAPYNIAWLRLRHSEAITAKLVLTGRKFFGRELASCGIAYSVTPNHEVVSNALNFAKTLAGYPDRSLITIKKTMNKFRIMSANAWFDQVAQ